MSDVEDVIQEVFVRAWTRLHTLRSASSFGPWLRRLASNVILRHRERSARRAEWTEPIDESTPTASDAPEGLGLDLEQAVEQLPPGARDVFVLFDVEGWNHREIASALRIAEPTSRSQLARARRLLRHHLR